MTTSPRDPATLADALLPCPFCGAELYETKYVRDGRQVRCGCGASGPSAYHGPTGIKDADARAIDAWNTRTISATAESQKMAAKEIEKFVAELCKPWTAFYGHADEFAAIIAKHCTPLPSSGDEGLEKAARYHDDAADTVAAEHPGIQGSKSQKQRRRHHIESAAAIRALKTTPTHGGEG